VVDVNTSYNALLGRPSLNKLGAIVSTPHLAMKFPSDRGSVATVYADQKTARECYVASLKLKPTETTSKRNVTQRMIVMTDLDPRINDDMRMKHDKKRSPEGNQIAGRQQGPLCLEGRGHAWSGPKSNVPQTLRMQGSTAGSPKEEKNG